MNNQITQSPSEPPSDVIMTDASPSISTPFPKLLKYLSTHTVYEAIPENMKILVFNNELVLFDYYLVTVLLKVGIIKIWEIRKTIQVIDI